jgi:RimJ/RimL family protein N-acetyltransferase
MVQSRVEYSDMNTDNIQEQIPNIQIRQLTPSQVIELSRSQPDIANHIVQGYKIPESDPRTKEEIVEEEFDHGENRTVIFLAEVEGKIVGSLYFILWRNNPDDKRGGKFRRYLEDNANGLIDLETLQQHEVLACDVGIVIHPDYQGKGIVHELYTKAVDSINPAFVVGQTKTPGAVIARSRILEEIGYSTSYGSSPVSGMEKGVAELITEAYFYSRQDVLVRLKDKSVHYAKTEALQPELNIDYSRIASNIANTFKQIEEADLHRPDGFITFAPLISIKSSLIK